MLQLWRIALVTYILYFAVLAVEVALGFAPLVPVLALGAFSFTGTAVFFALIRSDLVERCRAQIGIGQVALGVMSTWTAYALSGRAAPASTLVTASLVVYAALSMTPSQVKRFTAVLLAGLAAVMVLSHRWQPERFPLDVQLVTFLYAAIVFPLTARLALTVTAMQAKLREAGP